MIPENIIDAPTSQSQEQTHSLDDAHLVYSSDEGEHPCPGSRPLEKHLPCCPVAAETGEETFPPVEINVAQYVEVEFKGLRRGYYVNNTELPLEESQHIIVEAEKGIDIGKVLSLGSTAYLKMCLRTKPCIGEIKKVIRISDQQDFKILQYHREIENTAYDICKTKIDKHNLDMKLIDVEYQFDRNRITFYFTADGRIDFRELVKDLASEYRTRIELRQIGVRDQAKRIGGVGNCGRDLCCSAWIDSFEHISTEMARIQNLPMNPFKLAGQCGRLKCCLAYESEIYEERLKDFPPLETMITTPHGIGKIEKIDVFHDAIFLHYEKDNSWERLTLNEINERLESAVIQE